MKTFLAFFFLSLASAFALDSLIICDDATDPVTLDPQKQFSEKNHTIVQQIYDGLVRFDADGNVEAALAVSWKHIDDLRMEFKLRQGVRFHDGEPFNAQSVRFSIERYLDPKTGFPALGYIGSIEKVEIVDEYTINIVTKFPDGLLINRLAGFILIVPPRYIAAHGADALHKHPVGTGAFRFERWVKGDRIVLSANPGYWLAGHPKVDGLVFRFIPTGQQVDHLLKGDVDIVTELPGTRTTEVMASRDNAVIKRESLYAMMGSLNASQGPLKDKRVRQAVNHAIDREKIILYDVFGNGRNIASPTMSGEEGYDPDLKSYAYDPRKARELLKEAGYAGGVKLAVLVKEQGIRTGQI
ncbi:MAG: ABC transporter substrate-binding protein, partial [Elusimicrobiota bacterium]